MKKKSDDGNQITKTGNMNAKPPPQQAMPFDRDGEGTGARKRPPLERMKRIFAKLQDGKFPNCSKIAKEFEVSAKTALRDIEFMRDRLRYDLVWDARRRSWLGQPPAERVL